jgi:hypothetical protein
MCIARRLNILQKRLKLFPAGFAIPVRLLVYTDSAPPRFRTWASRLVESKRIFTSGFASAVLRQWWEALETVV